MCLLYLSKYGLLKTIFSVNLSLVFVLHINYNKICLVTCGAVPEAFTLYAPDESYNMIFPHPEGSFYTRTCTGAPNYLTVDNEKHYVNLSDTKAWFHRRMCIRFPWLTDLHDRCQPADQTVTKGF